MENNQFFKNQLVRIKNFRSLLYRLFSIILTSLHDVTDGMCMNGNISVTNSQHFVVPNHRFLKYGIKKINGFPS